MNLEKEMATHSSVLAWRIPGTGEPGGLPSVGSHRVRHDWSDLAAAVAVMNLQVQFVMATGYDYRITEVLWCKGMGLDLGARILVGNQNGAGVVFFPARSWLDVVLRPGPDPPPDLPSSSKCSW